MDRFPLHVATYTAVAATALGAAGCTTIIDPAPPEHRGLEATASAAITTTLVRSVVAQLTVRNTAAVAAPVEWTIDCAGNGPLAVRVYRQVGTSSVLVWDSSRQPPPAGCATTVVRNTIAPGATQTYERTIPVSAILGDSLAPDSYAITIIPVFDSPVSLGELPAATLAVGPEPSGPSNAELGGVWSGTAGGVTVTLNMAWVADSVSGTGTYAVAASSQLACGGVTLRGSGAVRFAGRHVADQVAGGMTFDNGWSPPYSGTLVDARTLSGQFHSVDAGGCPLSFTRMR